MNTEITDQMRRACQLASKIDENGMLPSYAEKEQLYIAAGFTSSGVDSYASPISPISTTNSLGVHAGLVGIRNDGNITVAFKGTEGALDWFNDFIAERHPFEYGSGNVHYGFYMAIKSIANSINSSIKRLYTSGKTVYITGHSKGGAMATLMAQMIDKNIGVSTINVTTFGSPRVGDQSFRQGYENFIKSKNGVHVRHEAFLDLVPHLTFSDDEKTLLSRMTTIEEKIISLLINLPSYYPVGERVLVEKNHDIVKIPFETKDNKHGETLNSFSAVMEAIRNSKIDFLLNKVHNGDYDIFKDKYEM